MRILILLLAMCLPVHATYIKYLATNVFYELDTNQVIVRPIGSPINANGTFVTRGPSFRLTPDQTTNVQAGNYIITNATLGTNIFFAVPTDTTTNIYLIGDLAISGYNTYNYTPGVRSLTAGDNITLSGTTGNVTISSSGGGTVQTNISWTAVTNLTSFGALTNNHSVPVTFADSVTAESFSGDGSSITNITARGWKPISFTNYFGTNTLTAPNSISNAIIDNKLGTVFVTATLQDPGISLVDASLQNITVSNRSTLVGGAALTFRSATNYPGVQVQHNSQLNNVTVYGHDRAMHSYPSQSLALGSVFSANNCRFYAAAQPVETWYGYWNFENCIFDAANTFKATGFETVIACSANDYSTNVYRNCTFIYGGNSTNNESIGHVTWLGARSVFNNCNFLSTSNASSIQSALYIGESALSVSLNDCTFNLNGGLLLYVVDDGGVSHDVTNNVVEFNNCFLNPWTNGVVVRNASLTNYVRGGNLTLANFERPEKVVFLDRYNFTSPSFEVGVIYTNANFACLQGVTLYSVTTDTGGQLVYVLSVDFDGDGDWDFDSWQFGSDSTVFSGQIVSCNWTVPLNVGSRWTVDTNNISSTSYDIYGNTMWRVRKD